MRRTASAFIYSFRLRFNAARPFFSSSSSPPGPPCGSSDSPSCGFELTVKAFGLRVGVASRGLSCEVHARPSFSSSTPRPLPSSSDSPSCGFRLAIKAFGFKVGIARWGLRSLAPLSPPPPPPAPPPRSGDSPSCDLRLTVKVFGLSVRASLVRCTQLKRQLAMMVK